MVCTGQTVKRPWYHVTAKEMIECGGRKRNRFAPNMMVEEPGKRCKRRYCEWRDMREQC